MRVPTVVAGLAILAAGLHGCSSSDSDVAPTSSTSTTVPRRAPATTTSTIAVPVPERAAAPDETPPRHARLRERRQRPPRITRQATRAHLAKELAARRPDRSFSPAELDQLTTLAMQIRVTRSRLDRMRPAALQTPRAAAMRARIDVLMDEFQTKAGVPIGDVPAILEMPPPPPRRPQ